MCHRISRAAAVARARRRGRWPIALAALALVACTKEGRHFDAAGPFDQLPPTTSDGDGTADTAPPRDLGPPVPLSLATLNVRNFFDDADDPVKQDDLPSAAEAAAKLRAVGQALRALDADVVALQEVENRALLTRLRDEELGAMGYTEARLLEGNDTRGIDVALLSRFPVLQVISHATDRFQGADGDTKYYAFSRDCLEVTLEPTGGRRLVLLINHLRAHDSGAAAAEADARRYAQANRVREIAGEALRTVPDANLAVLGDLNDQPNTKTLTLLTRGTPALIDVTTLLPAAERYTTVYQGDKELVDYVLVSSGLRADLVAGSVRIPRDSVFDSLSDHFPVVAEFILE
jgi:endonuclease/exonuclease/phosphatase family metal-dependent hydrolase